MFGQFIDGNYPMCNNYGIFTISCYIAGWVEVIGRIIVIVIGYFLLAKLLLWGQMKLKIGPWAPKKTKVQGKL